MRMVSEDFLACQPPFAGIPSDSDQRDLVSLAAPGRREGSEALYNSASEHFQFFDAHGFFANAADADADEVISLQHIERARLRRFARTRSRLA